MEMTSQRPSFLMHLLLLSCLDFFWLVQVKTEDQRITSNCTATAGVYIGDPANITCYFNMDLKEHSKPFNIYRYSIDKTNETLLKCVWKSFGQIMCDKEADGYEFDDNVSDRLSITIPRTTVDNIAEFTCNPEPSYPGDIKECYLMLKQRPTTVPFVRSSAWQNNGVEHSEEMEKNNINTAVIIVAVLSAVGILAAMVFLIFCRKRVRNWGTDKEKVRVDSDTDDSLIDTIRPILQSSSEEIDNGQPGFADDCIATETDKSEHSVTSDSDAGKQKEKEECDDSGQHADSGLLRQNLTPATGTGFEDFHSDVPVSVGTCLTPLEGTYENEMRLVIPLSVTEGTKLNAEVKAEKIIETAPSPKAADETKENATETKGREMAQSALASDSEITQFEAETKGGGMTQPVPVTETDTSNLTGSRTENKKPPPPSEITENRANDLKEAAIHTKDIAANDLNQEKISSQTDTESEAPGTVPVSHEKELDRWRQTAEEAENQKEARTERQILLTGGVIGKIKKRGKKHYTELSHNEDNGFPGSQKEELDRWKQTGRQIHHTGGTPGEGKRKEEEHYTEMSHDEVNGFPGPQGARHNGVVDRLPRLNVLFYQNRIPCRPDGCYIDEIHTHWWGNLDVLERNHSYIQWLFPVGEEPRLNRHAQQLYEYEVKEIWADQKACERFFRSYKMMLNFYGLELVNTASGEIRRKQNGWRGRYDNLQRNTHNYLRITRILTCLGEIGLEHFKAPFIRHMLLEAMHGNLLNTLDSCRRFWIETVVDDKQKRELIDLYNNAMSTSVMFSGQRPVNGYWETWSGAR